LRDTDQEAEAGPMNIVKRVYGILVRPDTEWPEIEKEPGDTATLFLSYVAILALIPAVCWIIGVSVIGIKVPVGTFRVPIEKALIGVMIGYLATFAIVYLVALVTDAVAPSFDSQRSFPNALKISVYGHTPFWVAGIFFLLPGLRFFTYILAFYGLYLGWKGLPHLMKTPREKSLMFAIAIMLGAVIVSIILGIVINQISGISGARRAV
jgi:divalent metal cation (Fe/Co/Zn/Cd) transporter